MPCWRGWRLWQAAGTQGWAQLSRGAGSLAPLATAATPTRHRRKPSLLPSYVPAKPRVGGRGVETEPVLPFPCIPPGVVFLGAHGVSDGRRKELQSPINSVLGSWEIRELRGLRKSLGKRGKAPTRPPLRTGKLSTPTCGEGGRTQAGRIQARIPWEALDIYRSIARICQERWLSTPSRGTAPGF